MSLFETKQERELRIEEEKKEREIQIEQERIDKELDNVRFFPGSIAEYESHVGYQVKIIDKGKRNMGVVFSLSERGHRYNLYATDDYKKYLVESKIEAIVNCNYSGKGDAKWGFDSEFYGLPVARKDK